MFYSVRVVKNKTVHVDTKVLNIFHQSQNCFQYILIGIPQHQKGYLLYVTITRKMVSSHDVVFEKTFLVCQHTRHIYIQRHLQRNQKSCIFHILHNTMKELVTLQLLHSLKRLIQWEMNVIQQRMNQFLFKFMSHIHRMTLMADLRVGIFLITYRMELRTFRY